MQGQHKNQSRPWHVNVNKKSYWNGTLEHLVVH